MRTRPQSSGRPLKRKRHRLTNAALQRLYRDASLPGSLGGVARFAKAHNVSVKRAKKALEQELAHTLHKLVRRRFHTTPVLVFDVDEQWGLLT